MTMTEIIESIDAFSNHLENELDVSDVDDFRENYPKIYAALLALYIAEQTQDVPAILQEMSNKAAHE